MKNLILILVAFTLIFTGFIFYNYSQAQKGLKNTTDSILFISLINPRQVTTANTPTNFSWHVESPSDFQTNFTGILYGYVSTPSALTKKDSPEAVSYPFKTPDYANGSFYLPDDFDLTISFPKPGRVWYRSYANVRGNHLWSEEKYLDITP